MLNEYGGRSRTTMEEEGVKHLKTLLVALGVIMSLPMLAQAADEPIQPADKPAQSAQGSTPPAKCLEAVVNPVTGYAFCVNPRGAPVDPPPRTSLNRPCKPRAHDDDAFTVYEHYSGCDE
jgi:hypothetical protein